MCIDCQQHEQFHSQFRAMFTVNTVLKPGLAVPSRAAAGPGRRKRRHQETDPQQQAAAGAPAADGQGDGAVAVCCAVCGTQVGAQDADEVVHFYNVLASNG